VDALLTETGTLPEETLTFDQAVQHLKQILLRLPAAQVSCAFGYFGENMSSVWLFPRAQLFLLNRAAHLTAIFCV